MIDLDNKIIAIYLPLFLLGFTGALIGYLLEITGKYKYLELDKNLLKYIGARKVYIVLVSIFGGILTTCLMPEFRNAIFVGIGFREIIKTTLFKGMQTDFTEQKVAELINTVVDEVE